MDIETFLTDTWTIFLQAPVATATVLITVFVGGFSLGRYLSNSRLSDLEERVRLRDDQLANKLSSTPPDQAFEMIRALEERISSLNVRRLTPSQRTTITDLCSRPGEKPLTIQVVQDGIGSDGYLSDFLGLFAKIPGWKVETGFQITDAPPTRTGIVVLVADTNHPSTAETLIVAAFKAAGLDFEIREVAHRSRDIELLVSSVYTG